MFGVNMKHKLDLNVIEILEENFINQFGEHCLEERSEAKNQIAKIQLENMCFFMKYSVVYFL